MAHSKTHTWTVILNEEPHQISCQQGQGVYTLTADGALVGRYTRDLFPAVTQVDEAFTLFDTPCRVVVWRVRAIQPDLVVNGMSLARRKSYEKAWEEERQRFNLFTLGEGVVSLAFSLGAGILTALGFNTVLAGALSVACFLSAVLAGCRLVKSRQR